MSVTLHLSKQDQKSIKMMYENAEFKDGNYQLPLPFRDAPGKTLNEQLNTSITWS